jgi:hypothetical protein
MSEFDHEEAVELVLGELLFFDGVDWESIPASEQVFYEKKARSIVRSILPVLGLDGGET